MTEVRRTEWANARSFHERHCGTLFSTVINRLHHVAETQARAIREAAEICADAIEKDGLVFTFGTGHGSFAAMEMFPRTGTVTGFRPIVESTMISFHRVLGMAAPGSTGSFTVAKATAMRFSPPTSCCPAMQC